MPILRSALSSTELLYERAMARFYKAVEYEQTENTRKRSISVDQETRQRNCSIDLEVKRLSIQADPQEAAMTRLRINSLTENEKKSVLRRRLSGDNPNLHIIIPKRLSFNKDEDIEEFNTTYLNTLRNEVMSLESIEKESGDEKFSDDYSDSTASEDDEYEDAETSPRRSRCRSNEKDAYHARMLSPYRQPQKDEAAEVLTKLKSPLPDPNFVPKPILKRPASADGRKPTPTSAYSPTLDYFQRRSLSSSPVENHIHRKSVETDAVPIVIQPKVESVVEIQKSVAPKINIEVVPKINIEVVPQTMESNDIEPEVEEEYTLDPEVLLRTEEQKRKLFERRQSSIEENRVMADFYGDIIKTLSLPAKSKSPIYMDAEALKKLETDEEIGNASKENSLQSKMQSLEQSTQQNKSPSPFSRRASDIVKPRPLPSPSKDDNLRYRRASETISKALPREDFSKLPLKATIETFTPKYNRLELNKSPSPQPSENFNSQPTAELNVCAATNELQTRGRLPLKSPTEATQKRRKVSQSRSRDSSTIRSSTIKSPANEMVSHQQPLLRRMKSSSHTRNRSESKSPTMFNRKIIINRMAPSVNTPNNSTLKRIATTNSPSPLSSRTITPSELQEQVDVKVKTSITYATDVSILAFATYVYFFKSALLALPILLLLIYRQLADKIPDWMKKKKNS